VLGSIGVMVGSSGPAEAPAVVWFVVVDIVVVC
jgi:hypothetical protein